MNRNQFIKKLETDQELEMLIYNRAYQTDDDDKGFELEIVEVQDSCHDEDGSNDDNPIFTTTFYLPKYNFYVWITQEDYEYSGFGIINMTKKEYLKNEIKEKARKVEYAKIDLQKAKEELKNYLAN